MGAHLIGYQQCNDCESNYGQGNAGPELTFEFFVH